MVEEQFVKLFMEKPKTSRKSAKRKPRKKTVKQKKRKPESSTFVGQPKLGIALRVQKNLF
jgi:hypothetical protein